MEVWRSRFLVNYCYSDVCPLGTLVITMSIPLLVFIFSRTTMADPWWLAMARVLWLLVLSQLAWQPTSLRNVTDPFCTLVYGGIDTLLIVLLKGIRGETLNFLIKNSSYLPNPREYRYFPEKSSLIIRRIVYLLSKFQANLLSTELRHEELTNVHTHKLWPLN